MSWTDERIGVLKKMWKEGKSAAEIAKTLGKGVTRNAVIGKAHRMGLSGRPSPIKKQAVPKKGKAIPTKKVTGKTTTRRKATLVSSPASSSGSKSGPTPPRPIDDRKGEKEVPPLNGGISLLDLTERMCKWPIGDPREPDFIFCGRGIRPGTPYCPDHAAMAYQTSSRSRQAAANSDRNKKKAAAAAAEEEEVEIEVDVDAEDVVDDDDDDTTDVVTTTA